MAIKQVLTAGSPGSPGTSIPSLPPDLQDLYMMLSEDQKRLFIKVFKYLWRYVNDRRVSWASSFWSVDLSRRRLRLASSELAGLAYLYNLTQQGARVVPSDMFYNSGMFPGFDYISYSKVLNRLKHAGYITRSTSDPGLPFLARSYRRQPVFISLTSSGVALIKNIDREIYNIMLHTSLDDITGRNKKE